MKSRIIINQIRQSIIATIAYYDIFNKPLSCFEIWKYLIRITPKEKVIKAPTYYEILKYLTDDRKLKQKISEKNGLYFLKGRNEIIKKRLNNQKRAIQKFRIIKKFNFIFGITPFLKSVFLSGSLAQETATESSDIDFMIIAREKRIWTCRFFLVLYSFLFKKYRHGDKIKNRFCLNHFITDDNLLIRNKNIYNAQTYANFYELGNKRMLWDFYRVNEWIGDYLVNFKTNRFYKLSLNFFRCRFIGIVLEFILSSTLGDILEGIFKKIQLYFIERNPLTVIGIKDGSVHYDNYSLEFHPNSIEKIVLGKFNQNLDKFLNK